MQNPFHAGVNKNMMFPCGQYFLDSLCPCFLWKREEGFITWRYCRWPSGLSTDIRKASKQPFLKRPSLFGSESVLTWVAFSSPVKIICTLDSVPWLSMFPVWTTTWSQNVFSWNQKNVIGWWGKGPPHRNNGLQPSCPSSNEASAHVHPLNPYTLPIWER